MRHDVVVVGDGPAGSAVAAALHRRGVDTLLVGAGEPWLATYGTWADDVESLTWLNTERIWAFRVDSIAVDVAGPRVIERPYGVVDNSALRTTLQLGVPHRRGEVSSISSADATAAGHSATHHAATHQIVTFSSGETCEATVVIDATGWPGWTERTRYGGGRSDPPRQTALGVLLAERPSGALGEPMLMDFSSTAEHDSDGLGPSFAYALPVPDGWLVEETVLAARPRVSPDALVARLAARLQVDPIELDSMARRIERVDIPMGGSMPDRSTSLLAFGAAASMIHPATGYSFASSLVRADVVAEAIGIELGRPAFDHNRVWDMIWPVSLRRTRVLHDYGLDVLIDLDLAETRAFFSTFFDLDPDAWAAYLRITTEPAELARVMGAMFKAAPWRLRRRLVSQNPLAFARLLRPG